MTLYKYRSLTLQTQVTSYTYFVKSQLQKLFVYKLWKLNKNLKDIKGREKEEKIMIMSALVIFVGATSIMLRTLEVEFVVGGELGWAQPLDCLGLPIYQIWAAQHIIFPGDILGKLLYIIIK